MTSTRSRRTLKRSSGSLRGCRSTSFEAAPRLRTFRNPMVAIGVGVIGCGDIARIRYFPSIEALPQLKLAGVYSRTPAQCNDIVRRYGGKAHNALDSFLHDD